MAEVLKKIGFFSVFFISGVGGGLSLGRVLDYLHAPDIVLDITCFLYWCVYCVLFTKIEFKSDKKSNYVRGFQDGYEQGQFEGLHMGLNTTAKGAHEEGYEQGLLDGRAEGWDYGYECAQMDSKSPPSADARRYAQQRVDALIEKIFSGQVSPFTGKPLTCEADYLEYLKQREEH